MAGPFLHRFPVRFADVDHAGIVYYPKFYDYFHQTFEELFRQRLGADAYAALIDDKKIGFPAVATRCEHRLPLRFGDLVEIEMRLVRMGQRSMTLRYDAFRVREREEGRELAAFGEVTTAVVDLTKFRAISPPEPLVALFRGVSDQPPP